MFQKAMSAEAPPPAALDLDRIVQDGYRARRRHRAVLGGAATAGVAAVAAVLALSIGGAPVTAPDPADPTAAEEGPGPAEEFLGEPSMAGYRYQDGWASEYYAPEEAMVSEAVEEAFAPLLAESGVLNALGEEFMIRPLQRPGNYGQTWLRSYAGVAADEVGSQLRPVFSVEALLPGGWTAEPGPVTEQLFPQHLIGDVPHYTDQAPAFESTELDDGRTLFVADHGCAYDLAVLYPNGTGLRVSWDVDCSGETHAVDLDDLTDAVVAMPEFEFDTTGLTPVGELRDIPTSWVWDPADAWVYSGEARSAASDTYAAAADALQSVLPGSTLSGGAPVTLGLMDRGAVAIRSYSANGTLPFETIDDGAVSDVYFDLRYYLPGGWVPGASDFNDRGPEIHVCKEEFQCDIWGDDNGTQWGFEERVVDHEPGPEEDWEAYTEHEFYATLYAPEGWAVGIWVHWLGDAPIDADQLAEILRAMPAPEYDPEDLPVIPGS